MRSARSLPPRPLTAFWSSPTAPISRRRPLAASATCRPMPPGRPTSAQTQWASPTRISARPRQRISTGCSARLPHERGGERAAGQKSSSETIAAQKPARQHRATAARKVKISCPAGSCRRPARMKRLRITILGCGSSGGVPRIGPDGPLWGACDPDEPRNRRRRCALLAELLGEGGTTTVLIDAGPDIREQLIEARAGRLDAVFLTHDHADHVHGLDDLRMVAQNRGSRLPCWMDERTDATMMCRFRYLFETPEGSNYPPILDRHRIEGPVPVIGLGGTLVVTPFEVLHGSITALGVRIGPVVYTPDVSEMPPSAWAALSGAECWILDALRYTPHPSHANVETALQWAARAALPLTCLTNLHTDVDYATLASEVPENVCPAHDGLVIEYEI